MNRNDKRSNGNERQAVQPAAAEICPHCGKPLYECGCTDRWENEGGATRPPEEEDLP